MTVSKKTATIRETLRSLFPKEKSRAPKSIYKSSICANKLETFILLHKEKNKQYSAYAYQLLRVVLSKDMPLEEILLACYQLRGIYSMLVYQSPLLAKGLHKEIALIIK